MERIGTDTLHFLCRLALPLGELPPQAAERAFAASTLSVFALLRHLSQRERQERLIFFLPDGRLRGIMETESKQGGVLP